MFYENMSDLEIDFLVSAEKWKERCLSLNQWNDAAKETYKEIQSGTCVYADARYCNNPTDAWPIIVENHINIEWFSDDEGIYASAKGTTDWTGGSLADHENPLRAAMICFLKMKGE